VAGDFALIHSDAGLTSTPTDGATLGLTVPPSLLAHADQVIE
jgi:hypothetical protein